MRTEMLVITIATAVAGTIGFAHAQGVDIGKREFESNCATCHGKSGKGDGPMAGYLMLIGRLPDLTTLTARNNGVFPFAMVYDTIDGTRMLKGHGTGEMPVWGLRYSDKATEHYSDYYGPFDAAAFARGRVLALTEYLHRIQAR